MKIYASATSFILPFKGRTEVGMGLIARQTIYPIPIPSFPLKGKELHAFRIIGVYPCSSAVEFALAFLRRPSIDLRASTAHQHRALGVAQPIGHAKGLDALLIIDERERA